MSKEKASNKVSKARKGNGSNKMSKISNGGITLIALVVTIVVLLILAGVSIAMLTGNNGILNKAADAQEETVIGEEREQVELAYVSAAINKLGDEVTADELQDELDISVGKNKTKTTVNDDDTLNVLFNDTEHNYNVNKGCVTAVNTTESDESVEPGQTVAKTQKYNYTDINGDKATIPAGFSVSIVEAEQIIDNGLVITDGTSEFVWIPVPTAVSDTEANGTANKAMAINLGTEEEPQFRGLLYDFSETSSTVRSGCTTTTSDCREPVYLNSSSADAGSYNIVGITESSLQEEYNEMIASVQKYGGFYVGRYETSLSTATATDAGSSGTATSRANVLPTSASNSATNTWYGLYQIQKEYSTSSVQGSMIWGSQWDAMLNFALTNSTDASKVTESTNGNHGGSVVVASSYASGSDKICNIYDLEGNMWEWTLEADDSNARTLRGGVYSISISFTPSHRWDLWYPSTSGSQVGSRLALYIK